MALLSFSGLLSDQININLRSSLSEPEGQAGPEVEIVEADIEIGRERRRVGQAQVRVGIPHIVVHGEIRGKEVLEPSDHVETRGGVLALEPFGDGVPVLVRDPVMDHTHAQKRLQTRQPIYNSGWL